MPISDILLVVRGVKISATTISAPSSSCKCAPASRLSPPPPWPARKCCRRGPCLLQRVSGRRSSASPCRHNASHVCLPPTGDWVEKLTRSLTPVRHLVGCIFWFWPNVWQRGRTNGGRIPRPSGLPSSCRTIRSSRWLRCSPTHWAAE